MSNSKYWKFNHLIFTFKKQIKWKGIKTSLLQDHVQVQVVRLSEYFNRVKYTCEVRKLKIK